VRSAFRGWDSLQEKTTGLGRGISGYGVEVRIFYFGFWRLRRLSFCQSTIQLITSDFQTKC
jgi:hypothetical protein